MVNLRFHIVSLVAVFLALALGVTMGSAFIDRATVDTLRGRLDQIEDSYRERGREIDELEARLLESDSMLNRLAQTGSPLAEGRLEGRRVLVVATRGIDGGGLQAGERAIEAAAGVVVGRIWLEPILNGASEREIEELGQLVDGPDASEVRSRVVEQLGEAIAEAARAGTRPTEQTALRRWSDAGVIRIETGSDGGSGEALVLVVSGPQSVIDVDAVAVPLAIGIGTRRPTATMAMENGPPRAAGSAPLPGPGTTLPPRGVFVGPLRADRLGRSTIATVDDGEQPGGRISLMLGLEELTRGRVVHLGEWDGAEGPLPAPDS